MTDSRENLDDLANLELFPLISAGKPRVFADRLPEDIHDQCSVAVVLIFE